MKILGERPEEFAILLRAETIDDLWHLAHIVRPGDLARGLAFREPDEAKAKNEERSKVEKKPMRIGVRVEKIEFAEFSDRLRLLGRIEEGPQDLGKHHALTLEVFSELEVAKPPPGWRQHERDRLHRAESESARPLVAFLAIEENEAVVALLRPSGVQRAAEVVGHGSGKQFRSEGAGESDFFAETLAAVKAARPANAPLFIVGPGFAKERFVKFAREKDKTALAGANVEPTGQAGMPGVYEAIKRGVVERVEKEQRVAFEVRLVEELLARISSGDGRAAYAEPVVRRAIEAGAIEKLLVTDELLRDGAG
ncbi:MAG: mRNA surveillance protein pelota, partial [Thermoplasmatota archaeon]